MNNKILKKNTINSKISINTPCLKNTDINITIIENKIINLQEIIKKTIISSQKYKGLEILTANEINICIQKLEKLFSELNSILFPIQQKIKINEIQTINKLQEINAELSSLIKAYGTYYIDDLIDVCLGNDFVSKNINNNTDIGEKYEIINKYIHPINYKILTWKKNEDIPENNIVYTASGSSSSILQTASIDNSSIDNSSITLSSKRIILQKNRIVEDYMIIESSNMLDCFDMARTSKIFQTKVYGIKISIPDYSSKQTIIICGVVDDILLECLNYSFITKKIFNLNSEKPKDPDFTNSTWERFILSLTLKEILIYENKELYDKYIGYITQIGLIKQKTINQIVKDFISSELYNQRLTLIQLLLKASEYDFQYLAYLLYDLLSNDINGNIDTQEQTLLFDSFPWNVKKYFRDAMKQTVEYTNNLSNFDNNKIPLEQQICLLKASDNVKEKAMQKLKEVKAKSEDSGSKARQYLDGLLRVPFGIYKEEYILKIMNQSLNLFNDLVNNLDETERANIEIKEKYTNIEMYKILGILKKNHNNKVHTKILDFCIHIMTKNKKRPYLSSGVVFINNMIKKYNLKYNKICHSGKKIDYMMENIINFLKQFINEHNIIQEILDSYGNNKINYNLLNNLSSRINIIEDKNKDINNYMVNISNVLSSAVHGHDSAKRQVERIIGQWINGDKTGYCFGFEGAPGIGKCFAKDTPILLSNGEIKMVQNITIEDKLMGDDSAPRNVLALGNGIEKMYKIEQMKGDDYTVNESHILSLKMTMARLKGDKHQTILGRRYFKNDIVDICIKDYLSLPTYLQECLKGYKVGIDFPEKELDLEPYALGYWLGDGNSNTFKITTIDKEIVNYFKEYASNNGLQVTQGKDKKNENSYHITTGYMGGRSDRNKLLNYLKNHKLINNKHIPEIYKINSRENRLKLLAGLIDSDGYCSKKNNSLEIIQKNKILSEDILFLVRSLGFRGTIRACTKCCFYKGERKSGIYYRIIISGTGREDIPTLLERKRPLKHRQIKDSLNTGIKIIPLEEDKYYGFQIDGNSRFLLGDFTVTHNTSLAKKGIANCLKDVNGDIRPFAFIAIGGASNSSTLDGHNYTYVGSTWGRIVDILMETKCMNPIIFIDELDKISRTEHGKEITGILTHLIDSTQNDCYQDKYFNGIDLDLSKALFIFSYNDPDEIDRILLDRIHRVKFDHLTLDDKIIITEKYILPEIYKKIGLENIIEFENGVIEELINTYTCESGVRKLKELIFEIISEINLLILKNNEEFELPIKITMDQVKNKYLKEKRPIKIVTINNKAKVGVINGLWANSLGKGGILHIETYLQISSNFLDLKLTGLQGDVMKESMSVAKTLAWSMLTKERMAEIFKEVEETKLQGLHIHVPEGGTKKDGPSAGTAITVAIYSLLTGKKIKNNIAITGEICLQGKVGAIGGLDLKILGGINAGVTCFIYPKDNNKDFLMFYEKYKNKDYIKNIEFIEVEEIQEVINLVLLE